MAHFGIHVSRAFVALALTFPLYSGVIYSTFGPGDSYDTANGQIVYRQDFLGLTLVHSVATPFIPAADTTLGSVWVAVDAPAKEFKVRVTATTDFSVLGGTDGAGASIEEFDVIGTGNPEILKLSSILNPLLHGGVKYWVQIVPGVSWNQSDSGTWFNNNQGLSGTISTYDTFCKLPCAPYTRSGELLPAVKVLSFEPATETPEPASWIMLLLGLTAILSRRLSLHRFGVRQNQSDKWLRKSSSSHTSAVPRRCWNSVE